MTEIKLHTYGERLIVSEKVTLASGNINSAELHVTVDEAWAAYTNYSAIFETKEYIEPVEKLMVAKTATEYVCVIPSEVLQHQGTLEIGIRGITNDGEMAKTSSVAKYNIVKGASPGNITLKPTMDMYQQYLAAMDSKVAPLFEAYKTDIKAELTEDYGLFKAALLELFEPVPLWTNPDPYNSSVFYRGSVVEFAVDLSKYRHFLVVFTVKIDHGEPALGTMCSMCSEKGVEKSIAVYTDNGNTVVRSYVIEDDGITFTTSGAATHESHGAWYVPYQVIGFTPIVEQ